jgi:hypothetical protein
MERERPLGRNGCRPRRRCWGIGSGHRPALPAARTSAPVITKPKPGGEGAHERRGATDRHQHRAAAGAAWEIATELPGHTGRCRTEQRPPSRRLKCPRDWSPSSCLLSSVPGPSGAPSATSSRPPSRPRSAKIGEPPHERCIQGNANMRPRLSRSIGPESAAATMATTAPMAKAVSVGRVCPVAGVFSRK